MNLNLKHKVVKGEINIKLILVGVIGLFLALLIGTTVGSGEVKEAYIYILMVVGSMIMVTMRQSYWLFIPFAMVGDLPAVPLGGLSLKMGEAWLFLSLVFLTLHTVTLRKLPNLYYKGMSPLYAYVIWVGIIFIMNPVGLSSLGAGSGGFRFYLKIGLSLLAALILLNQEITDERAKKMMKYLVIGVALNTAWSIASVFFPVLSFLAGRSATNADGFYTWQQNLVVLPNILVIMMVARYPLRTWFRVDKSWLLLVFVICMAMGFASGKRSLTMLILIYPILGSIVRKQFFDVFIAGTLAFTIIAFAVVGHGSAFTLPKQAQRVLSIIPAVELDGDVEASSENGFRETLNRYALEEIKERPILGEGLQVDFDLLYDLYDNPGHQLQEGDHYLGLTYSANSNWHNTWLGISADFGIPAAVIWAWLVLALIFGGLKTCKRLDPRDWRYTILMFIVLWTIGDLLRSWQFGHSAVNLWQVGWRIGIYVAIRRSLDFAPIIDEEVEEVEEVEEEKESALS